MMNPVTFVTFINNMLHHHIHRHVVCETVNIFFSVGNNCPPLNDPDNGKVYQFPDGSTAIVTCKSGYITSGQSFMQCINGKWSSSPPKCLQS